MVAAAREQSHSASNSGPHSGIAGCSGATTLANEAQAQHGDDPRFPRLRARALFESGDTPRALSVLETTAKAFPRDSATQFALADMYKDAGRDVDSERTLRQLLEVEPAAQALGYIRFQAGNEEPVLVLLNFSEEEASVKLTLPEELSSLVKTGVLSDRLNDEEIIFTTANSIRMNPMSARILTAKKE